MKKTISIILAIMLMVSLFGCTNQNAHDHGETALDTSVNETIDGTIGTTDEDIETTDPVDDEVTEPVEDNDDETEPVEDENGGETETTEPVETQPVEDNTEATEPVETQPVETEHVHNYTSVVTAPTCEDKGYTTYTCTCGDSYVADETKATGHKYETKTVKATCGSDGYDKHTCSVCGDSYTDNKVEATGKHDYKTTTVAPTTSSKGYDLHKCSVCGDSYKDNYTDKLVDDEEDHDHDEDNCGLYNHSFSKASEGTDIFYWEMGILHPATCEEDAYYEFTCTKCGYVHEASAGFNPNFNGELSALGHDYNWEYDINGKLGYDKGTCSRCGQVDEINPTMAEIPSNVLDKINEMRANAGLDPVEYSDEYQELASAIAVEKRYKATRYDIKSIAGFTGKGFGNYAGGLYGSGADKVYLNAEYTKICFALYKGYYYILMW